MQISHLTQTQVGYPQEIIVDGVGAIPVVHKEGVGVLKNANQRTHICSEELSRQTGTEHAPH